MIECFFCCYGDKMTTIRTIFLTFFLILVTTIAQAASALYDLNNKAISLSSLKGHWVYINYWASWCQPCLEEIPELNGFYSRFKGKNVVVYGVNYDALPASKQQQLIRELGIQYPSLGGNPARALSLGDIRGVPVTFVFNPQGKLSKTLLGPQSVNSLKQAMDE
jgi:thiol-disulfide isomerase/thioredoxin